MAVGDLSFDFEAAQSFRTVTVIFAKHALGFRQEASPPQASDPIINSFRAIADQLRKTYSKGAERSRHDDVSS